MTRELRRATPDLDAEQEVDLGRYASAVAARWWLPLLGLIAGLVVGYLLALGGSEVFRASALVYPGQPLAVGGGLLPPVTTSPATIRQILTSEAVIGRAAAAGDMTPAAVRSGLAIQVPTGAARTPAQATTLISIGVDGPSGSRVARAANELARITVVSLSRFVNAKIESLSGQLEADQAALEATARSIEQVTETLQRADIGSTDRAILGTVLSTLESRRATLKGDVLNERQLLSQANEYEKPRLIARAVARETTARSRRNSVVVGGVIGLLLGLVAAAAWEPVTRRAGRTR